MHKHLLLFCHRLQREVAIVAEDVRGEADLAVTPGRCGQPALTWDEVDAAMPAGCAYASVDVIGGACVARLDDATARARGVTVHRLPQCFQMLTSEAMVTDLIRRGFHLVTPGWLADWQAELAAMGFDQPTARALFAESCLAILLLDTRVDGDAEAHLRAFAAYVDRPSEVLVVGLGVLDLLVRHIVGQQRLESFRRESATQQRRAQQQLSHYAMALDLLKTFGQAKHEDAVVEQITEVFRLLFAPERVVFTRAGDIPTETIALDDAGFIVPLARGGTTIGTMTVARVRHPEHLEQYLNLAHSMLGTCSLAIENARYYQEIKELSETDGLTGVANRRKLDEALAREWRRMSREARPLSALMCDVDYFKRYNDAHGHLAGDDCLRAIARALRGVCRRPGDLAARYGGEEFVALLPGVDANRAAALGLAVRDAVANIAVPHADSPLGPHVTVSVGVATLSPTRDGDPTALLRAADAALYCAKSEGRNRVAKAP